MSGETEAKVSGWTVDTPHAMLASQIAALDRRVPEQFNSQQVALAAALAAQEKAVAAALAAAEKAVDARQTGAEREFHEHLEQYRHEVDLAFAASDRAITKAETAAERRFEGMNEFRGQLTDQAATFMSRTEAAQLFDRNSERIQELTDRINRSEGKGAGFTAGWAILVAVIGVISTVVATYLAVRGH